MPKRELNLPEGARVPNIKTGPFVESTNKLKCDLLSEEHVELTDEKCAEYIELPHFEGERNTTDRHVQDIHDQILSGTFNWHSVLLVSAWLGDVRYKVNGQHTCWAVYLLPRQVRHKVREQVYRVKDTTQLANLYATFDTGGRTSTHMDSVQLVNREFSSGLPVSFVQRLGSGLKFHLWESEEHRRRVSPQQFASIVEQEHADLFKNGGKEITKICREDPSLRKNAVIAAMFATFNKVHGPSIEFWSAVATGLGLNVKTDARYRLRDQIPKMSKKPGAGGSDPKRILSPENQYRVCIAAWNKWRKGEPVNAWIRPTKRRVKPI